VLGSAGVSRDERQVDLGLHHRESSILAFSADSLSRCSAMRSLRRSMLFLLEFVGNPIDDALVEVVAAEERIAIGAEYLEDPFSDVQNEMSKVPPLGRRRDFWSTFCPVHRPGAGGRLIDDTQYFEAGDTAGIFVAWRWLSLK